VLRTYEFNKIVLHVKGVKQRDFLLYNDNSLVASSQARNEREEKLFHNHRAQKDIKVMMWCKS
jgi:hypothetical protein